MKTPRIANAVGHIDDDLVSGANRAKAVKKNAWLKWGSIAACFAVMLIAVVVAVPMMLGGDDLVPHIDNDYISTPTTPNNPSNEGTVNEGEVEENKFEKSYSYGINDGAFSAYIRGKVIAEDKVGSKIEDVAVTAGWKNEAGEWISTENLHAEVYVIDDISEDVAVALKFVDQGEAVTTTHYYVIMNPKADLTVVGDYIIAPIVPNNPGDEMAGEVNE